MKIWLKLLVGAILGMLLGRFIPSDNQEMMSVLLWAEDMAIRIGRYSLAPILVFSLTMAICELRQEKRFWSMIFRTFLVMLVSAVFVISAGILAVSIFPPAPIPVQISEQVKMISLETREQLRDIFPSNMFSVLIGDGVFPICVFAFFCGMGLSHDRHVCKPVITVVDSLSRIFYQIVSFFSEILGLAMIALGAYWTVQSREAGSDFQNFMHILGILGAVLGVVLLPLLLHFFKDKRNPWMAVYGALGPGIAALFSGDINFSLPLLMRQAKEGLGIRRRVNMITLPLFATFGRAGSAMVAAVAFIVIVKSYSSLEMTTMHIISIGIRALVISFFLSRYPGDGAYTALALLCQNYGAGYQAGYLILKPIAFYIIAIGACLDVLIAFYATYAIDKMLEPKERLGEEVS
jgi:Na+/H+-dicarboxylate symporter